MKDEDVRVKTSSCQKCQGIIRTAILHMMTDETKTEFALEAFENNLSISEMKLQEYRAKDKFNSCFCAPEL